MSGRPQHRIAPAKGGQLSPHFHVDEFRCKDRRRTRVPPAALPALRRLCRQVLEPLRAKFGPAVVLSGYRTRAHNRAVSGATQSQHIYDDTPGSVAADVTFRRGTPKQWAAEANRILGRSGGVGRYDVEDFVHVDNRAEKARWPREGG